MTAGSGFPVTLVRLNDGTLVVGNRGGAKHYVNRTQAEAARAKLDDSYEVWQPARGRVFYIRKRPA